MLTRRLRERAPSARPVAVASLAGHELRWHKLGRDQSGKCDIVRIEKPEARVVGVVYEILVSEKTALDAAEGLGNGYAEQQVALETASGEIEAYTYYATSIDPAALPYTWYQALVVAGAREHGLPEAYIGTLEAMPARDDADTHGAAKNFAIANAGYVKQ